MNLLLSRINNTYDYRIELAVEKDEELELNYSFLYSSIVGTEAKKVRKFIVKSFSFDNVSDLGNSEVKYYLTIEGEIDYFLPRFTIPSIYYTPSLCFNNFINHYHENEAEEKFNSIFQDRFILKDVDIKTKDEEYGKFYKITDFCFKGEYITEENNTPIRIYNMPSIYINYCNLIGKKSNLFLKDIYKMDSTYLFDCENTLDRIPNLIKKFSIPYFTDNDFKIKDIKFNGPSLIVFWQSGDKTVVTLSDNVEYDVEKAIAFAFMKKALSRGNTSNKERSIDNICNILIDKYKEEKEDIEKEIKRVEYKKKSGKLCLGIYPDLTYKWNIVKKEHLNENIEYNKVFRPGRAYYIEGERIINGITIDSDDSEAEKYDRVAKEFFDKAKDWDRTKYSTKYI